MLISQPSAKGFVHAQFISLSEMFPCSILNHTEPCITFCSPCGFSLDSDSKHIDPPALCWFLCGFPLVSDSKRTESSALFWFPCWFSFDLDLNQIEPCSTLWFRWLWFVGGFLFPSLLFLGGV